MQIADENELELLDVLFLCYVERRFNNYAGILIIANILGYNYYIQHSVCHIAYRA